MKNPKQYKGTGTPMEGTVNLPETKPTTVSAETRQLQSAESRIKALEETISMQHNEIAKLRRDIGRLKGEISDIISVLKNRG